MFSVLRLLLELTLSVDIKFCNKLYEIPKVFEKNADNINIRKKDKG